MSKINPMLSPAKFVEEFGPALQEYLEYQYGKEGHLLDMIPAAGEFFTVSYHSVYAAMDVFEYTSSTTSKSKTTSKK
jgi:hypothetical protein